jgi:hypothetical protein
VDEWNFMCHFYSGIVKVDDFRNNGRKGALCASCIMVCSRKPGA